MVWYNITDDEFDWIWERSDDGGETWDVKWQIKYKRNNPKVHPQIFANHRE
jgi:hypothetical protein